MNERNMNERSEEQIITSYINGGKDQARAQFLSSGLLLSEVLIFAEANLPELNLISLLECLEIALDKEKTELLEALEQMVKVFGQPQIDSMQAFAMIEKAKQAIANASN